MIIYIIEKSVFLYKFLKDKYNKGRRMSTASSGTSTYKTSKAIKLSARNSTDYVLFNITPEMSEQRSVSYAEISDLRLPASILIYMGSPSRRFSINAKFLARTQTEADISFKYMNLLKSWCVTDSKRYLGSPKNSSVVGNYSTLNPNLTPAQSGTANPNPDSAPPPPTNPTSNPTSVPIKAPATVTASDDLFYQTPQVLYLTGYGTQFRSIPVVVRDLNITFPTDVDYIQNSTGAWVPILQDIGISLQEARNVYSQKGASTAIAQFDLSAFKAGTLPYW